MIYSQLDMIYFNLFACSVLQNNISAMLPPTQQTLECLMKSKTNFILFGSKSSGKTHLINKLLKRTKTEYIYLNCILTEERTSFLALFNFQLKKYLYSKSEVFLGEDIFNKSTFKVPPNIQSWIDNMRKIGENNIRIFSEIGRIYIFVDKIEELVVSEKFLSGFFRACTTQLNYIKFSFIFCGVTNKDRLFNLEDPFRSVITFCLDKPNIKPVIKEIIESILKSQLKDKCQKKEVKKLFDYLLNTIWHKFESLQNDLEKIRKITKKIVKESLQYITHDLQKVVEWINSPHLKQLINQIAEYGPINPDIISKKQQDSNDAENFYEHYPNLFLTAVHLAENAPESEDKRRFVDYRRSKTQRKANSRHMVKMRSVNKKSEKIVRNNVQRIISIAEVLESQAQKGPQKYLQHHSLDFYGCIEYLKEESKLYYYGKDINSKVYGGKVIGKAKEEEVRFFLKKLDLDYNQFMS